MSMRFDIETSIINNVNSAHLPYEDKVTLALNLFKDITESLDWLDFEESDGLEELDNFKNECENRMI